MLNKLEAFIRQYDLIHSGDLVVCAVSGGADSMALLFGMYLLSGKLGIKLEAAHFNHCLRAEESDQDARFVREFCEQFEIPFHYGEGKVCPGEKGLEAAARAARYGFLMTLNGKIATAHTADDNAETVLMHLIRGTGLKGLGGISPKRERLIRPMLDVTRAEVLAFLEEYHVAYRTDSSNLEDRFLRNRLRHHVLPLLKAENPRFAQNTSAMALRLRQDEEALQEISGPVYPLRVSALREQPAAVRVRMLERFLKDNGVREPEAEHLAMAEALVFSDRPSAKACFPGEVLVSREYDFLCCPEVRGVPVRKSVPCPGSVRYGDYLLVCTPAAEIVNTSCVFTISVQGTLVVRSRESGDRMRTASGHKTLKKLYIDRKIPADLRPLIPVLADDRGVAGVFGIGADGDHRALTLPAWQIRINKITDSTPGGEEV